jgi:hypothetical protein
MCNQINPLTSCSILNYLFGNIYVVVKAKTKIARRLSKAGNPREFRKNKKYSGGYRKIDGARRPEVEAKSEAKLVSK